MHASIYIYLYVSVCMHTLFYQRYKFMSIFRSHGHLMFLFFGCCCCLVLFPYRFVLAYLFDFIFMFVFICRFVVGIVSCIIFSLCFVCQFQFILQSDANRKTKLKTCSHQSTLPRLNNNNNSHRRIFYTLNIDLLSIFCAVCLNRLHRREMVN